MNEIGSSSYCVVDLSIFPYLKVLTNHLSSMFNQFYLLAESYANLPPLCFSSWKLPSSATFPCSRTKTLLQRSMVLILCAMMMTVLFYIEFSIASCTFFWLVSSRAEVASSRRRMEGWRIRVRAMATLCFWPPESLLPLIPHWRLKPSGSRMS